MDESNAIASGKKREVHLDVIERWIRSGSFSVKCAAINMCKGRMIPLDVIERWMGMGDFYKEAAMSACSGRSDCIKFIRLGLECNDGSVQRMALDACDGLEIKKDVIDLWMNGGDEYKKMLATEKLSEEGGLDLPSRMFDPPDPVYKKCVDGVIVVASIPKDAKVRGGFCMPCRASKAIIRGIIGDTCGEKVAVSKHDLTTLYYIGDEVEIDDFDLRTVEFGAGFHFFCTMEEAMACS